VQGGNALGQLAFNGVVLIGVSLDGVDDRVVDGGDGCSGVTKEPFFLGGYFLGGYLSVLEDGRW